MPNWPMRTRWKRGEAVLEALAGRADVEVLDESLVVHAGAVVGDRDALGENLDANFSGVGVEGVVHQLAQQLDALGVELLAEDG